MTKMINVIAPLALGALLLAGCAKPPAEQIEAAEKAMREAQQSGAATYSAQDFAKLEASIAAMKKEAGEQDSKFALLRDYGKVEQLAASAKAEGERVKVGAFLLAIETGAQAAGMRGSEETADTSSGQAAN